MRCWYKAWLFGQPYQIFCSDLYIIPKRPQLPSFPFGILPDWPCFLQAGTNRAVDVYWTLPNAAESQIVMQSLAVSCPNDIELCTKRSFFQRTFFKPHAYSTRNESIIGQLRSAHFCPGNSDTGEKFNCLSVKSALSVLSTTGKAESRLPMVLHQLD